MSPRTKAEKKLVESGSREAKEPLRPSAEARRAGRTASGSFPKGVVVLLGVLVMGSAVAAFTAERPKTFEVLTARALREKGAPVPQTATAKSERNNRASDAQPTGLAAQTLELAKLRRTGEAAPLANALLDTAESQIVTGQPQAALPLLDEALELMRSKVKDAPRYGQALHAKGWALLLAGKGAEAVDPLTQARAVNRRTNASPIAKARTLELLTWAEREAGQPANGVAVAKALVVLARSEPATVDLAGSLNSLGVTQVTAGDPSGALVSLRESVRLRETAGGVNLATSLHSLGWALLGTKNKAEAAVPLSRAVEIRRTESPGTVDLANSLLLLGWAAREANDFTQSLSAQRELVEVARRDIQGVDLPASLEGLGVTLVSNKQPQAATAPLQEAVGLRGTKASVELANSLHILGWAYVVANQPADARTALERAVTMRTSLGLSKAAADSKVLLSMVKK